MVSWEAHLCDKLSYVETILSSEKSLSAHLTIYLFHTNFMNGSEHQKKVGFVQHNACCCKRKNGIRLLKRTICFGYLFWFIIC